MFAKCIIFFVGFSLQYQLISTSDSCHQIKNTCQECISDPSVCVWCAENDFNGTRCMPQSSVDDSWCPKFKQNPINKYEASEKQNFSSVSEHIIQIKPQRYKLKLRQGVPQPLNFSFQGAQDYPVDLYFLLDASKTMENIKNNTAEQGQNIYLAIKKMTNNVHLGFGTFIDKRMLPIMSNTDDPELTYSFRHHLKLVDDFMQFKEEVTKSPSGVSRDKQEGGLDALAQVLVCEDIIGWRKESRKIVVFLTDGPYHAAGDGKSAGLFEPYDGQCYTENGTYTKEREMDYPSVGMINKLAAERDIIIIFVVAGPVETIYDGLKKLVSGSHIAKFGRDMSKNDAMVTILKNIYKNISKKIKLIAKVKKGNKKNLKISFDPDCTTNDNNPACDVENGKELHIVGTVQYDSAESAVVDIIVEGIGEKLTLEIDPIKSCDCERNVENISTFCYGEKRVCGKCSCSDNRYGDRCGCVKSEKNDYRDTSTCIAEGSTEVCSGSLHGSCICGTCQCTERYKGKFCECDIYSCPRSTRISPETVCSGPEHGECDCGRCKCSADWSGDACDCYKPDTSCKEYNSHRVCNDRGQCVCGECQCDQIAEWDARNSQTEKCQILPCTDCHERQCGKLKSCAKCHHSGHENCISCDDRMVVEVVETLTEEHKNSNLWNLCSNVKVKIGCQTSFVYRYNDTSYGVELVVAKEEDCAPSYILFGGIFLVTLLLVGAGTLIAWKLLTDARDRHEYLKFMQQNQQDASGPSENPLYTPPTTTFNNPAFRKRSVDVR